MKIYLLQLLTFFGRNNEKKVNRILKHLQKKYLADRVLLCDMFFLQNHSFTDSNPKYKIRTLHSSLRNGVEPFRYKGEEAVITKYSKELIELLITREFYFCKDFRRTQLSSDFEKMYEDNQVHTSRAFMLEDNKTFLVLQWLTKTKKINTKTFQKEIELINKVLD